MNQSEKEQFFDNMNNFFITREIVNMINKIKSIRRKKLCESNIVLACQSAYKESTGKKLCLENPLSINEKLQYLKLNNYYDNPLITRCVDKYLVKQYVEEQNIGIRSACTYAVYDRTSQIEWESLPNQFVIKCNHGSGYNFVCRDKSKIDRSNVEKEINRWMQEDYWKIFVEPQYKNVNKKILIEEYLGNSIKTFKFYCFNGVVKISYVSEDGENGELDKYIDFFDEKWNRKNIALAGHLNKPSEIEKPENLDEMLEIARKLSKPFPFVRVDLYDIDGVIYLSELTFIPTGGYMRLTPEGTDIEWGNWLDLSQKR